MNFELDARLRNDTHLIGESGNALLLLMNDNRYPWCIIVPTLPNISEWFELPESEQVHLHQVSVKLGQCIKQAFNCDKINIAALGNIVRQMHIHVIGRATTDTAWPGPVWGHSPATPYSDQELNRCKELLHAQPNFPFPLL